MAECCACAVLAALVKVRSDKRGACREQPIAEQAPGEALERKKVAVAALEAGLVCAFAQSCS